MSVRHKNPVSILSASSAIFKHMLIWESKNSFFPLSACLSLIKCGVGEGQIYGAAKYHYLDNCVHCCRLYSYLKWEECVNRCRGQVGGGSDIFKEASGDFL